MEALPGDRLRRLWPLGALMVAWVPALLDRGAIGRAAEVLPLAAERAPLFDWAHAGLLYLWLPLVVLSASVLFLTPGLCLALTYGRNERSYRLLLDAFAWSVLVLSAAAGIVQELIGQPLRGAAFATVAAACGLAGVLLLAVRGTELPTGLPREVLPLLTAPLLFLLVAAPKFHWENFNGDGVHAYESVRLLLVGPLPFWGGSVADLAAFPDLKSVLFTLPASWFLRLFGEFEASVRLPFVVSLVLTQAGLLAIVEARSPSRIPVEARWLTGLSAFVYSVVMAWSATYNPYAADIALPAAQDTLAIAMFTAFILGFLERSTTRIVVFASLTFFALPSSPLLIALWLLGALVSLKPHPWREASWSLAALAGCLVTAAIVPLLLRAAGLPTPGDEYAADGLLARLRYLQVTDVKRILWVVVPGGILPALSLGLWNRQDGVARALTLTVAVYAAFFYVQAYVSLHYFVPAMLLPVAVLWRVATPLPARRLRRLATAACVCGSLALWVSLPEILRADTSARRIGGALEDHSDGYARSEPAAIRRSDVLLHLFPYDFDPKVPLEGYGGSPHVWRYYAHRGVGTTRQVQYLMQPRGTPAPGGFQQVGEEYDVALFVRDPSVWAAHRALHPPHAGAPIYRIPREILFRRGPGPDGPRILDVRKVLGGQPQ